MNAAADGLKLNVAALGLKLKDGLGNADAGGGCSASSQLSAMTKVMQYTDSEMRCA